MNEKSLAAAPAFLSLAGRSAPWRETVRAYGARTAPRDVAEPFGLAGYAAAAALAALAWIALQVPPLPPAAPATAPAAGFSATRAFAHVQALARAPRPIASAANAQAREYIIERVRGLGLEPSVQEATVQKMYDDGFRHVHVTLAVVRNIVVPFAGSAPDHGRRPALLLVSHYDSGEGTLGAADGAASSAAMLEALRALRAGPAPKYDTVFLFSDGDKAGALGAQAFVEQHPLARRVGLALRFDNAGNRGPLVLYDTRRAGSDAISGWASGAPDARGSVPARAGYELARGGPRIGPLAQLEAPVLQFATLAGPLGADDTPDRLDHDTLQHEGDTMLGLVRHFTATPLAPGAQAGQVWFALAPFGVLHYPAQLVWPLTRLACLLLVGACCLAAQRARVDPIRLVQGTFGFALIALGLSLGAGLLWKNVPALQGAHGPAWLAALCALGAALFICLQRLLQRSTGMRAAALGALVCVAIALVLASWLAPEASYLLAWPLLAALCAFAALHSSRVAALPRAARNAIVLAGAAPAVVLVAPALRDAFAALPPRHNGLPMALIALLLALLLGLCVVPLASIARRFTARALVLAALACLAIGGAASPVAESAPQPNPLIYYKDMPTWSAWWLARPATLDGGARQLFPDLAAPRRLVDVFGWDSDDLWYARAPRTDLAFPDTVLLKNESGPRHVEFVLASKNRAPAIELSLKGGKPVRASVNGRVLTDQPCFSWSLSLYGMEDQPLHFSMDLEGDPSVEFHVEERIPGLPRAALPPGLADAFRPMTGMTIAADDLLFR